MDTTTIDHLMINGITPAEAAKFESLFMLLDAEGSGGINEEELADLMPRMGVFLSEEELHQYFASVDSDGSGEIDFQEFLSLMARHREANQLALLEGGRECFRHLKAASHLTQVLRSDDPINWVLDTTILILILFYGTMTTYEDIRGVTIGQSGVQIKIFAAVLSVLDIVRGMFTSISSDASDTLPVDNRQQVRHAYMHSKRIIYDVVAAIPADVFCMLMEWEVAMVMCQHLRLVKFLVIPHLFKLSPSDTMLPRYARFHFVFVPLLKICFWAIMVVHVLSITVIWYSETDVLYDDAVYFVMYTLTTTGFGDQRQLVETERQKAFAVVLFCCASVVTGLVVGKLVQFSQQADLQTDANRRMLETLAALNHLTIPPEFKEEVLAFQQHRLKHSNSLFNEAISGLPQVMQDRMALYARMKIVRQVPIFAEAQEICVAKLAQSLVNVFVPPEEYIVIAGEEGEEMFFLFHGMCGVTLPNGKWAATIKRGGVFGEVALLQETRRSASIKSLTYCQLFRLDKVLHHHHHTTPFHHTSPQAAFQSIVNQFPILLDSIQAVSVALQMRLVYATLPFLPYTSHPMHPLILHPHAGTPRSPPPTNPRTHPSRPPHCRAQCARHQRASKKRHNVHVMDGDGRMYKDTTHLT